METGVIQNSTVFQKNPSEPAMASPVRSLEDRDNTDKPASLPSPHDEYIKSENSSDIASGLYKVVPDENGSYKILYDDPKAEASKSSEEECTVNTDKADREIEKLKESWKGADHEHLVQQINSASGDEGKVRELEKKLAAVEKELAQKDNDAYRRQNAVIS